MGKPLRSQLVLALLLVLASCSDAVSLDEADADTTVAVKLGDTFVIDLESNPSTGFSWLVEDATGLTLLGETWSGDSELIGSPGITRFEFRADQVGTGPLRMVYTQPWTDDDSLDRRFSVEVQVTK